MNNNKNKERLSNFELMRVISMIMIIMWHIITRSKIEYNCSESISIIIRFIKSIIVVHVNSFILVSGYFQYNKQINNRKIFDIIKESWFYRVLFIVIFMILGYETLTKDTIKEFSIIDITQNYWFVNYYIALLIISPFINKMIKIMTQKEHRSLIIILMILFSIIPTISSNKNIDNSGFSLIQFILMYIIGSYFGKYKLHNNPHFCNYSKLKIKMILITVCTNMILLNFLLNHFANYLLSSTNSYIQEIGYLIDSSTYFYSNPLVIIQSCCYFLFFESISINSKFINKLSKLMLGVYMIHDNLVIRTHIYIWLRLDTKYIFTSKTIIFCMIVLTFVIFIICSIIERIRILLKQMFTRLKSNG